ncbi:pyridoxamine 5'-phosphate oxidase family protein [Desulfoluna spongiiphila]|uniref:Pyridoxamine 5'-phosphate oxidase n=1 Tax=Desulfoluna spongiiphila TaxID=419481 RepID=A0A1G5AJ88_9BACT|nr:pyridoxamine 5'-phosphate oxidase family protein [Desulfoluna spongiiphila]SCX77912.1 Pyridoxamine 5'-phosphate oxidase [Desulfoluna spongiiphila]
MQHDIPWSDVVSLFSKVPHSAIATVDPDGCPRVSPIGSVLFTGEGQGYYFEKFPEHMRNNLERDPRMSIMAVAPGIGFWTAALWRGKFKSQPAIRLVCEAGARRQATEEERRALLDKVRLFRRLKGHDILWKHMSELREFTVIRIEPVELGKMNPS